MHLSDGRHVISDMLESLENAHTHKVYQQQYHTLPAVRVAIVAILRGGRGAVMLCLPQIRVLVASQEDEGGGTARDFVSGEAKGAGVCEA